MKKLNGREQIRAIIGVAKLSFQTAPGAVLFKMGGAIIDAVLPIITTYFAALTTTALVDAYAGNSTAADSAIRYVIITAALGLLMTVWSSIDQYVQAKMRYVVEAKVSDRMYEHFLSLDFWRYDDKDTADIYDRAVKFSQFYAYVFDRIASIVSQLIAMLGAVIALALVHVGIALFTLCAIIPGVYLQFKLSRKQIKHWNENVEVRRAQNMLEWHLNRPRMISELRLYGMVNHMLQLRRKFRDSDEKTRINFEKQYLPLRILADLVEAMAELGSLIWITFQIVARTQPVGQFVYVQQIVSRAMTSANGFVSTLASIDEDIANLFDYEQFMQLPVGKANGKKINAAPDSISVDHVDFTYPGSKHKVLNDITLTISKGQHVAIVGENGAGKSTFIKLITGLYEPGNGSVELDGTPLSEIDIASWHEQLGVLQQEFIMYEFATAGDNVRFGKVGEDHTDKRLKDALQEAEADSVISKLPRGVDTYVNTWMEDASTGSKGVDLSGGQWQRLALARDFYRNAPIIILDEPTSAIDALAEARIFKRLFADKNRTVITISHRLSTVEKADVIYMLEEGKIVESGTHAELVATKGRYYRMFESQITS